jgi:CDP-4-dehydro-6-deoxyglucose reductase
VNKFQISLANGKFFVCDENTTILDASNKAGLLLEHSCLRGKCRSCIVKVISGTSKDLVHETILSNDEKKNHILSCISIPTSNMVLDIEDAVGTAFCVKKIVPSKILSINNLNDSVIAVSLRLAPNSSFVYKSGQYVNIIKSEVKRSYSIANVSQENGPLNFLIKKYENGLMSDYWFKGAKVNDLLRIEGPLGSFFLRETKLENIIFLATGTGIAPIKAILEDISRRKKEFSNKIIWLFVGARYHEDIIWEPSQLNQNLDIRYIIVLSRGGGDWDGERGYVQDIVVKQNIPLDRAHVYACGSYAMIEAAKTILIKNGLNKNYFFSDAFVPTS